MRIARPGAFVLLTAAVSAGVLGASVVSCTHGNYDGSFDAAALGEGGSGATAPPVTKSVPPSAAGITTIGTSDGVFEVDVPAHAFPGDVAITITQLPDRSIDNGFAVPAYQVTVAPDGAAALPVQVVFRGNASGSGGPSSSLLPVTISGTTAQTLLVTGTSNNGGGPSPNAVWGLTKTVSAVYSLGYVQDVGNGAQTLLDPSNAQASCIRSCCNVQGLGLAGGGPNNQLYATENGCACSGSGVNLACFVTSCPDIAASAQRCLDLALQPTGTLTCQNDAVSPGATCNAGSSICCHESGTVACVGPNGGGATCNYVEKCTQNANCAADGAVCCAYDGIALCSKSCPESRRVCGSDAPCASGTCRQAGKCSIHVCGAGPSGCQ